MAPGAPEVTPARENLLRDEHDDHHDDDHQYDDVPAARQHSVLQRALSVGAVIAALCVLAAATLVAPLVAVIGLVIVLVLLRTVSRTGDRLASRRERYGDQRGDGVMAALGTPWHVTVAALDTALSLPVVVLIAALPAGAVWLLLPAGVNGLERPELAAAAGCTVGALIALTRRSQAGGRRLLRQGLRRLTSRTAIAVPVIVAMVVTALLLLSHAEAARAVWWPA